MKKVNIFLGINFVSTWGVAFWLMEQWWISKSTGSDSTYGMYDNSSNISNFNQLYN